MVKYYYCRYFCVRYVGGGGGGGGALPMKGDVFVMECCCSKVHPRSLLSRILPRLKSDIFIVA
jgi:hypothetical protein